MVCLTLACGARTGLLEGEAAQPLSDAGDATSDGEEAPPLPDATSPGPDGALDASPDAPVEASILDASADGDADATGRPDSGCGPDTCEGCCRDDGSCVRLQDVSASFCGSGGLGCLACPPGIECGIDTADGTRVCAHFLDVPPRCRSPCASSRRPLS